MKHHFQHLEYCLIPCLWFKTKVRLKSKHLKNCDRYHIYVRLLPLYFRSLKLGPNEKANSRKFFFLGQEHGYKTPKN